MKAIILCAGIGTRLRPLTERWPKPAIPVLGQPLLRFAIAQLKRAGATEIGINTHHRAEVMEAVAAAECARAALPLEVVREPTIQGTAGGIRGLRRFAEDDHFLVVNGDILFPLDLRRIEGAHREAGCVATLVLTAMPARERYAAVEVDGSARVRRIAGRGPGGPGLRPWHFTGVHVISPVVFDFIAAQGAEDITRDVYPRILDRGLPIHAEMVEGYWSDLGTPARYLQTQLELLADRGPEELQASRFSGAQPRAGGQWVRSGARIDAAAIRGPALFDEGCAVEPGAVLGPEVYVGPRAIVRSGARLERTVVLEDTEISSGEDLADLVAWGPHRLRASQ